MWAWKTARSPTQNAEADGRKARTPWIWKKNGPLLVITLNKYRTVSRARQADGFRSAANLSVDELKDSTFSACVTKVYGLASVFSELKHKLSGTGDVPHEGNKGAAEVRAKIQKTARLQTYSNHHEMTFFVYPSQRSLTQCCAPLVSDCVGHPTTHASHSLSVCSANRPISHFLTSSCLPAVRATWSTLLSYARQWAEPPLVHCSAGTSTIWIGGTRGTCVPPTGRARGRSPYDSSALPQTIRRGRSATGWWYLKGYLPASRVARGDIVLVINTNTKPSPSAASFAWQQP